MVVVDIDRVAVGIVVAKVVMSEMSVVLDCVRDSLLLARSKITHDVLGKFFVCDDSVAIFVH